MAMRFCILGSGSSGNAALLVTENARVLVDAGFSARKLNALLAPAGESLDRIDAVFLTHEHGDHAGGVESLKKHPHLRVFANAATARAVQARLTHRPDWQLFETGARFRFRDLEVESFAVPHDAQEPVGFRFSTGHEGDLLAPRRSLTWLTDLGHAPQNVREAIRGCEVVVVEANHCPELLKNDVRRPWSLKQRIGGRHGHLSNEAARALLAEVASPQWRRVYLTHLSRECNTRAAVETAFAGLRSALAACEFAVVGPGESTPVYEFAYRGADVGNRAIQRRRRCRLNRWLEGGQTEAAGYGLPIFWQLDLSRLSPKARLDGWFSSFYPIVVKYVG